MSTNTDSLPDWSDINSDDRQVAPLRIAQLTVRQTDKWSILRADDDGQWIASDATINVGDSR